MKKYLFIFFMIINVFFITNVYAYTTNLSPNSFYYADNNNQYQGSFTQIVVGGSTWYRTSSDGVHTSGSWLKFSFNYNLSNLDYDYVTFVFRDYYNANIMADLSGNVCETANMNINSSSPYGNYVQGFICRNTRSSAWLNFNLPQGISSSAPLIDILTAVGGYNDTTTAAIATQTTILQQQHQESMNNDSSSFNSGIQDIADNTQIPNNSGLFDILSTLSSFTSNLSASGACSAITIPIPFTNQSVRLPCMTTEVYSVEFPEVLVIWQLIVRGLVYYYIIVNFLKLLKETIDPFSMKLEVLDL